MSQAFLWIIVGPTGAGKSELALKLAEHRGAEIISADSQQVYRGMDIGTGKLSLSQRRGIPHHLLDILEPSESMTTAQFQNRADGIVSEVSGRGREIAVAGGTMLYIRSLLLGLSDAPGADQKIRSRWEDYANAHGVEALRSKLREVDPPLADRIELNDKKRLIRALEVFEISGEPLSRFQSRHNFKTATARYSHAWIGLSPPREILDARIDERVVTMMERGFLDEVKALRAQGYGPELRSQQAIGYRELHQVLDDALSLDEAIQKIQQKSRKYARRQMSWYRDHTGIRWLKDASELDPAALQRY